MVDADKTVVGQICHIEAAEAGGERYNASQTDEERASFDNLLLLCKGHHEETDDVVTYTVAILKKIKDEHEARNVSSPYLPSSDIVEKIVALAQPTQHNANTGSGLLVATQKGDIIIQGISLTDSISLFKELFELNMPKLTAKATETAERRTTELWEKFTKHAVKAGVTAQEFESFAEPDAQAALAEAIKTSALAKEGSLQSTLARLLVERLKQNDDLRRVVVTESISTLGKLTANQLRVLALSFIILYCRQENINTWTSLNEWLEESVEPLLNLKCTPSDLRHLEYAACGKISSRATRLASLWLSQYKRLFHEPLSIGAIAHSPETVAFVKQHASADGDGYRFPIDDEQELRAFLRDRNASEEVIRELIIRYFHQTRGPETRINHESPIGTRLNKLWSASNLKHFELTSVGIVIGMTIHEQIVGHRFDIDQWIN